MKRTFISKIILSILACSFLAGCACMSHMAGGDGDQRSERAEKANKGGK